MLQTIPAGFSRPVFESQNTFRTILQATAAPGRPVVMPVRAQGPAGWSGTMAAVVLTLCDMETPVWLDPAAATPEALRFLRFHCGCPVTDSPADAAFAVVLDPASMPALGAFASGETEYPEKSTTIFMATPDLRTDGLHARIHGPGVDGQDDMPLRWLPEGFTDQWRANGALYPRGVDIILVGVDAIVGLPRTLKVEDLPCT